MKYIKNTLLFLTIILLFACGQEKQTEEKIIHVQPAQPSHVKKKQVECEACNGSGRQESESVVTCPRCNGSGELICEHCQGTGFSERRCSHHYGSYEPVLIVHNGTCAKCYKSGGYAPCGSCKKSDHSDYKMTGFINCDMCKGKGEIQRKTNYPCTVCNGTKKVIIEE